MRFLLACLVLLCTAYRIDCSTGMNIKTVTRQLSTDTLRTPNKPILQVCTDKDMDDGTVSNFEEAIVVLKHENMVEDTIDEYKKEPNTDHKCRFFDVDISDDKYVGTITISIQIIVTSLKGPEVFLDGEATFELPDYIDKADITAQKVGGTTESLRLETSPTQWEVCEGTSPKTSLHCSNDGDRTAPCYVLEIGTGTDFSLCIQGTKVKNADDKPLLIMGPPFTAATITEEKASDFEALLTYSTNAKLKVTSVTIPTNLEFVAYKSTSKFYKICVAGTDECTLDSYVNARDEFKIIIVNTGTKASKIIPFKDYDILSTQLGSKIIEVFWKKVEDFYVEKIGEDAPPADLTTMIESDCSATTGQYCFGYFTDLDSNKQYHITVAPAVETTWEDHTTPLTEKLDNRIYFKPAKITKEQQKNIMGVTMLQHHSYADGVLQVCYKAYDGLHNNTRDEAILIDEDGHWIKIYQSTQDKDLLNCFSPVNLLTSSLRITKDTKLTTVIVERELTGYKVLASGQADIDLSGLRVIKPDEDNSSEGSTSTLAIVGASIGGVACLMALVAAAILFVMKRKRNHDGFQYPLHRTNVEGVNVIHGLDNPNSN